MVDSGSRMLGGRVAFDVPVEEAFAYLADPRNRPEWQSSLRSVEMLDDGEPRVGMRWRDHTVVGLVPQMEITTLEPGELWVEKGHWRGVIQAILTLGFEPTATGCMRRRAVPGPRARHPRPGGLGRHRCRCPPGPVRRTPSRPHPRRAEALMGRAIGLFLSALMILVGVVWTFQGLGYIEGSPMTGVEIWAVLGPALAGFGIALGIVVLPRPLTARPGPDATRLAVRAGGDPRPEASRASLDWRPVHPSERGLPWPVSSSTSCPSPRSSTPRARPSRGPCPGSASQGVSEVRQGKRFELELDGEATEARLAQVHEMAATLLSNPVIEDYASVPTGSERR